MSCEIMFGRVDGRLCAELAWPEDVGWSVDITGEVVETPHITMTRAQAIASAQSVAERVFIDTTPRRKWFHADLACSA